MSETHPSRHRGLTLVEILVVVALIVLLVSLVTVAVNKASQAAARTQSANALREMIGGYNSYSADHNQRLMPGYIRDEDLVGPNAIYRLNIAVNESYTAPRGDLNTYVWRLFPYVGNSLSGMLLDYNADLRNRLTTLGVDCVLTGPAAYDDYEGPCDFDEESLVIQPDTPFANLNPAFGLNSVFVGGNDIYGDSITASGDELTHPLAARRISQVRNPSSLIVFGSSGQAETPSDPDDAPYRVIANTIIGHHDLRAPFLSPDGPSSSPYLQWTDRQWTTGVRGRIELVVSGGDFGIPVLRHGLSNYPVAHLDGSVMTEDINEIANDMRRWSPFVTGTRPVTGN